MTYSLKIAFLFFLALTLVWGGYNLGRSLLGPKQGEDFAQYYVSSRLVLDGQSASIYDTGSSYQQWAKSYGVQSVVSDGAEQPVMTNAYPPFVSLFMIPFALLPYNVSRFVFFALSVLATPVSMWFLFSNREKTRHKEMAAIGTLAAFLFFPNYYSFYMGQINSILFLFCALALHYGRTGRRTAGLMIGLAGLIKLFPLFLVLFFAGKRQFNIVWSSVVCAVGLTALTFIFLDHRLNLTYFSEVLPSQISGGAWFRNQGFTGFFSRLLTQNDYVASLGDFPSLSRWLSGGFGLVTLATVLCFQNRLPERYDIDFGFLFVGILLAMSKSYEHYAMFLFFSYLFIFEAFFYERIGKPVLIFCVFCSYCVWAFILSTGVEYQQLPKAVLMSFVISSKFFATLILFGCNIAFRLRK